MSTLSSYTIQSALTLTEKSLGKLPTITLTNGAVAGSEVVTVTPATLGVKKNISIQIASGTSTATQVRAAILASSAASAIVTPTIESGQGATALVTCVNASLSGGTLAAKASLVIGALRFVAKATGTSGNSTRIKFTSGATAGSEQVSISTLDITIQIEEGVSTSAQVKAAVDAYGPAAALVDIEDAGPALSRMKVCMAVAFRALAGGAADVAPATVVQDLTFSSDEVGTADNGKKISYTHGATAGAEVVSASSAGDITIQIQNGASTATQIKAAADASAAFNGVKASGTITVTDYAAAHLTKAAGTITYGSPAVATPAVAATPSAVITFGVPNDFDTVIFTGFPTDGTQVWTKRTNVNDGTAEANIQDLFYNAATSGLAGNGITVQYVSDLTGNIAVVELTGLAILVHMDATPVTGTTANTIKAAVNVDPETSPLVIVTGSSTNVQAVQGITSFQYGEELYTVSAENNEFEDVVELSDIIDAFTDLNASTDSTDITMVVATAGAAMNSATITGTGTFSGLNITFSGGADEIEASTITVNGATFTSVAATPGATEFSSISELTALVAAVTSIDATDNGSVIAVVAATAGIAGNSLLMSKTGAGLTLVQLAGGHNAAVATVGGTAKTETADWNSTVSNDSAATSLASAINALSGVSASAIGPVVTVLADAVDDSGNAITLAVSGEGITKSGNFLSGGISKKSVAISGTGGTAQKTVNLELMTGGVGDGPYLYSNSQAGTTITASYVAQPFNFAASDIVLNNDEVSGTKALVYSLDGVHDHGTLLFGQEVHLDSVSQTLIWFKYAVGAPAYRVTAWHA